MNFSKRCDYDSDSESESTNSRNDSIRVQGNNIYFSGEVNKKNALEFNIQLDKLSTEIIQRAIFSKTQAENINVFIHSDGGCVFSGLSMMDHIKNCSVEVVTIADGFVASAATFPLIAGDIRKIYSHSQVLIHSVSTNFWGNFENLKDEFQNMEYLMKIVKGIYTKHGKFPRNQIEKIIKRELYLDSQMCLDYGIVDEIITSKKKKFNSLNLWN